MREIKIIVSILIVVLLVMNFQLPGHDPKLPKNRENNEFLYTFAEINYKGSPESKQLIQETILKLCDNADRIDLLTLKYAKNCKNLEDYYQNIISEMNFKNMELKDNLMQLYSSQQDYHSIKMKLGPKLDSFEQSLKDLVLYTK